MADQLDRFAVPLYTLTEAARYLGMPSSTLGRWARGYEIHRGGERDTIGAPVITALSSTRRGGPALPFIGLAEGYVLSAIRASGVPLQRVRPALEGLQREVGLAHALGSRRLFTDGAEVLYDYAEHRDDVRDSVRQLVVVRNGQHAFNEVVDAYLRRIEFASDGYAQVLPLPGYQVADLIADPRHGFGQPVFRHGGARLEDALALFDAGESLTVVAEEFGLPIEHLEDALRVAARPAA